MTKVFAHPPPCPPCSAEQARWLDTDPRQMVPGLGFVTQASAAYDLTPRGVHDRRTARHERWRTLVRDQLRAIADQCRTAGHAATVIPQRPPRVVQLDLFGEAA